MKRIILWVLCILAAALLILSFPAREHISTAAGDIMRIAGFIALAAFAVMRSVWRGKTGQE